MANADSRFACLLFPERRMTAHHATNEQLAEAYRELGNVWKVAGRLDMAGGSVHRRLAKMGVIHAGHYTEEELARIREVYASGMVCGDGKLDVLANELGRLKSNVCREARKMGLTDNSRTSNDRIKKLTGERTKRMFCENGHPRGMLGKKHSEEAKEAIGKSSVALWASMTSDQKSAKTLLMLRTKIERYGTLAIPRPNASWKAGWREIGDGKKYYRSRWEANYARYLQFLKEQGEILSWEHEPTTFWFEKIKRGCRSYLPDFRVVNKNGTEEYHEVKGWMDDRSKTKIKRMAIYYPKVVLRVLDAKWFKSANKTLRALIPGWE
jgi:hypothetical protein